MLACCLATVLAELAPKQGVVQRGGYLARAELQAFVDEMVQRHGLDRQQVLQLFAQVQRQDRVLEAISRPAEAKPWREYRPIFLTQSRIDKGVDFWGAHETLLDQASQAYGVDPEYIVAILGVETYYGRRTGSFPVLDALTTLAFDYPPRAKFFRRELEQYLLLTVEEGLDPLKLQGSYAGAMGQGQFISSSYREYAVDFDGDGRRDLWGSTPDAIGSVANYFRRHGWDLGEEVTVEARTSGADHAGLVAKGLKPSLTLEELSASGVEPAGVLNAVDAPLALIELEGENGRELWIGFNNFYVITRYNRSPLYAMAVHQLAQEIRARHIGSLRSAEHR
ncbi:MAG: lytic murein transglycosylase B [Chromatiales bacterium]|jgi:membrane-bound lytic murein transglycosylase B